MSSHEDITEKHRRMTEEAEERAKRCPQCGEDTSHMPPQAKFAGGDSMVQWDVTCPACRKRFWVDLRARHYADQSPFYWKDDPVFKRKRR